MHKGVHLKQIDTETTEDQDETKIRQNTINVNNGESERTLSSQEDMRSAAIAQAGHFLSQQEVHSLWHNGAQAVSCTKAAAAVQPKHKHLEEQRTHSVYSC